MVWAYLEEKGWTPTIEEGDMEVIEKAKPDYLGVNYYATATVAAAKNDGTDCQPRNGDQQIMLGEEGVYRAAQNNYLEQTEFGWMVDSIGMRVTPPSAFRKETTTSSSSILIPKSIGKDSCNAL